METAGIPLPVLVNVGIATEKGIHQGKGAAVGLMVAFGALGATLLRAGATMATVRWVESVSTPSRRMLVLGVGELRARHSVAIAPMVRNHAMPMA